MTAINLNETAAKSKQSPADKCKQILDKVSTDDLYEVIGELKSYASERLAARQRELEDRANELQSKIDKL
jgi:hypothetical protein